MNTAIVLRTLSARQTIGTCFFGYFALLSLFYGGIIIALYKGCFCNLFKKWGGGVDLLLFEGTNNRKGHL